MSIYEPHITTKLVILKEKIVTATFIAFLFRYGSVSKDRLIGWIADIFAVVIRLSMKAIYNCLPVLLPTFRMMDG